MTRQAGTVAAFEPLLESLRKNGWDYEINAYEQSKSEWDRLGYDYKTEEIVREKDLEGFTLLLSGTSTNVTEDAAFWSLAQKTGIPSIAFVDSWINYHERFSLNKRFDRTPDFIGLIDDLMYKRMIECGAPEEKLVILGHPRFDILSEKYIEFQNRRAANNKKKIIFFTDPVSGYRQATGSKYGTKEIVSFTLDQFVKQEASKEKIEIIIKPHPRDRERTDEYQKIMDDFNVGGLKLSLKQDPHDLICKADVVIGSNTILLVDSSKLGIPTYSIQPGKKDQKNDITDRKNIHVLTTWKDVEKAVHSIVSDKLPKEELRVETGRNIERFISFINHF